MQPRLAIIAGTGDLPVAIARADGDALFVTFEGAGVEVPDGLGHLAASFEKLGALFEGLRAQSVSEVVFAGAMSRPMPDATRFDEKTAALMPGLIQAMGQGDDSLLRHVIKMFEAEGFAVRAVHEVAPDLLLAPHMSMGRVPSRAERADALRALDILIALSPQDVAQAAVVESGLCLGIETLQGTDAMLKFVADTPAHLRRGRGVFVKAPKQGQDLRIDMPSIGPHTVRGVVKAGLAGLFVAAGAVLVLEQDEVRRLIEQHDLFLMTR
ncbi:MAG TPA: LpxI family protein [Aliiroseovarius sp.]|nr:LpxI family protein [Aliiroseovarius sp.]